MRSRKKPLRFFAVCAPGLEKPAWAELRALGIASAQYAEGGVEFAGDWEAAYRANLHSRIASRILLRVGSFAAETFEELHRQARRIAWDEFFAPSAAADAQAVSRGSRLRIKKRIAETTYDAIADRLGFAPAKSSEGLLVLARLADDVCELSVDTSGELLHRRGYRQEIARAPLRETLAAGILRLAEYDPRRPLADPMCGSGVFAAEAAWLATNRAPGRARPFAFLKFASFQPETWARLTAAADAQALLAPPAPIVASDISGGAVAAARGNLARAGLADVVAVAEQDIAAAEPPPGPGLVVLNPPYGGRVGANQGLEALYARIGEALRGRYRGWKFAILAENERLFRQTRLAETARHRLLNGGKKVTLFVGAVR
jgi:putative N6-adenine-specific DNA methylase